MKNEVLPKEHIEVEVALERNPKEVFLERIDEEHCNPLQLWEEMGSPQELTKQTERDAAWRQRSKWREYRMNTRNIVLL